MLAFESSWLQLSASALAYAFLKAEVVLYMFTVLAIRETSDILWRTEEDRLHTNACRYGYITWEWREAVRGYAHPLLFAALFKLLALSGLDSPAALVGRHILSQIHFLFPFRSLKRRRFLEKFPGSHVPFVGDKNRSCHSESLLSVVPAFSTFYAYFRLDQTFRAGYEDRSVLGYQTY